MSDLSFEINARDFATLVRPVIPLANKDGMLPVLNSVRIESRGDVLVASATDRFRLGFSRLTPERTDDGLAVTLRLGHLRQILTLFKASRTDNPSLRMTVTERGFKVEQVGGLDFLDASITVPVESGDFPDLLGVIRKYAEYGSDAPPNWAVDPRKLADFQVAARDAAPMIVRATDPSRPIIVTVGEHFIGVIMPVRLGDPANVTDLIDEWVDLLNESASKPKRKATSKKKSEAA